MQRLFVTPRQHPSVDYPSRPMGQPYALKQVANAQRQQPADFIYRGVRYAR